MAIYDFKCQACGEQFEALVRKNTDKASCPSCQSDQLEQLISSFAMSSDATRKDNIAKAQKGFAKARRDAAHAQKEAIEHHHDHHH